MRIQPIWIIDSRLPFNGTAVIAIWHVLKAIGGALGNDLAQLTAYANAPTLIALGMAGFLAAVTQAPLTASIIVMEMVDGHALVLSLMATAMVASGVSKLISAPLYSSLAELQLHRLKNWADPVIPADKRQ